MTAVQATELRPSQFIQIDARAQRGQRVFSIHWTGTTPITAPIAINAAGLPDIGDAYGTGLESLKCVSIDLQCLAGINEFRATCNYESDQVIFDPRFSGSLEQVDVWRKAAPPLPGPGPSTPDQNTDIGGLKLDQNGVPAQRYQRRLQFSLSTAYTVDVIDDIGSSLQVWRNLEGSVNETIYHGFDPLTVMYLGPSSTILRPKRVQVTHHFLHDKNLHMVQFPGRDQDGEIEPVFDVSTLTWHAKNVYWRATWDTIEDFTLFGV